MEAGELVRISAPGHGHYGKQATVVDVLPSGRVVLKIDGLEYWVQAWPYQIERDNGAE